MKKLCTFVFALLLTNVVMGAEALKAKVTWVSDGDSFIVEKEDGSTARVRCACIDAPENDQPYGDTAKKAAIKMLKDKEILVQVVKVDKYQAGNEVRLLRHDDQVRGLCACGERISGREAILCS